MLDELKNLKLTSDTGGKVGLIRHALSVRSYTYIDIKGNLARSWQLGQN